MTEQSDRQRIIARASWLGIAGNGVLAVISLYAGYVASSMALIGAGIDTLTDVITSVVTLYTARIVDKPPDAKHPYGHARAETIATKLLAFVIFFAGAQLALHTVEHLISGELRTAPALLALEVAAISVGGKIILAFIKWRGGKKAESPMLLADAKNMMSDVLISLSVLLGIFFTVVLELPLLDSLVGLGVSMWIMRVGIGIFFETNTELMDGISDHSVYRSIYRSALAVEGVSNPHKMRVRKLNNRYTVELDIEVAGEMSVDHGHELAREVQDHIHRDLQNVYDVHVHVEPEGNTECRERFGLSCEDLDMEEE